MLLVPMLLRRRNHSNLSIHQYISIREKAAEGKYRRGLRVAPFELFRTFPHDFFVGALIGFHVLGEPFGCEVFV